MPRAYMFGCVTKLRKGQLGLDRSHQTYNLSPVFKKRITAMPSIILAAELPRNLLLGFKVPSIRM
jgi:hypothetical protein